MPITLLDSVNNNANGASYTIPAGTNRLVCIMPVAESTTSANVDISAITIGTQTPELIVSAKKESSTYLRSAIYVLNEAGIASLTSPESAQTVAVTWGGSPAGEQVLICTLGDVDQTSYTDSTTTGEALTTNDMSFTLGSYTNGGFGLAVMIGAASAATVAFTTQDGWTEAVDGFSAGSASRVYSAYRAFTGSGSTSVALSTSATSSRKLAAAAFRAFGGSVAPIVAYYQSMQD